MTACTRQPQSRPRTLDKETMDPARPNDPEPSDPFNPERADHAILETIEIATEGEDCDECVRRLRPALMKINGVQDVMVDLAHERVIVKFDARKTHAPDLHDTILKSGYIPGPKAD
jgi:copper chaperone CopZ